MFSEIDYMVQVERMSDLRVQATQSHLLREARLAEESLGREPARRVPVTQAALRLTGHVMALAGQRLAQAGARLEERSRGRVIALEEGNC